MEKPKWLIGVGLSVSSFLIGDFDRTLQALLALIIVDFMTGILSAWSAKSLSSRKMYEGGIKKIGILFIVAVANLTDTMLSLNGALRYLTIGYYAADEGLSVLENWGKTGLPFPQKLKETLIIFREKNDTPEIVQTKAL